PRITADSNRRLRIGLEVVVPAGVLGAGPVGRDDGQSVEVRNAEYRHGPGLTRLRTDGGQDDHRQAGGETDEAQLAAAEPRHEFVEMVGCWPKQRCPQGGSRKVSYEAIERVGVGKILGAVRACRAHVLLPSSERFLADQVLV